MNESKAESPKPVDSSRGADASPDAGKPTMPANPGVDAKRSAEGTGEKPSSDPDDVAAAEADDAAQAAVAKPVTGDPVQVFGWREWIHIEGVEGKLPAKLDTGALTSSIHAEEKELFERDGKKWLRFIVTDPAVEKSVRTRIEAPLVRIAMVKEPAGESVAREVVRLSFQLGERKLRGEFSLNNRRNMLAPVLIGRSIIRDLGWVDASRTNLAEEKIFR